MIKLLWLIAVYLPLVGAQEPTFERFLDRDLWKQKPSANDQRILDRLIGEAPQHWFGGLRYLWKPKISGPARYLAMLAKPLIVIPVAPRLVSGSSTALGETEELHGSKNLWIREVARMAGRGPRERLWIW